MIRCRGYWIARPFARRRLRAAGGSSRAMTIRIDLGKKEPARVYRAGLPCETSRAPKAWPFLRASTRPPNLFQKPLSSEFARFPLSSLPSLKKTRPPSPVPRLCCQASPAPRLASTLREGVDADRGETVAQMQMTSSEPSPAYRRHWYFVLHNNKLYRSRGSVWPGAGGHFAAGGVVSISAAGPKLFDGLLQFGNGADDRATAS